MEYLETTLKDSIDEIFEVGEESFNEFYPRDKFLKRLEDKNIGFMLQKKKM